MRSRDRRSLRAWCVAGLVGLLALATPAGVAMAVFRSTAGSTALSISTATLATPTGFAASRPCPGAGPTLKGSVTGNSATTSLTLTTPSAASGDVLLAYVTASSATTITVSPSSWQGMGSQTVGSTYTMTAYFLPLSAAPAGSYTFSWGAGKGSVALMSYTGVDPYTPVANQQSTFNSSGTTSATSPTTTPSRAPGRVVLAVGVAGAPTLSDPAGLTRRAAPTAPDVVVGQVVWDAATATTATTTAYVTSWTGSHTYALMFSYLQSASPAAKDPTVTLNWTASSSPVTGYSITRSDAQVFTVSGVGTTSYVDSATTAATAYTYTLRTTVGPWTSSGSATANAAACP